MRRICREGLQLQIRLPAVDASACYRWVGIGESQPFTNFYAV